MKKTYVLIEITSENPSAFANQIEDYCFSICEESDEINFAELTNLSETDEKLIVKLF